MLDMINNDYGNVILYQEGADTGRVLLQDSPTLLFPPIHLFSFIF